MSLKENLNERNHRQDNLENKTRIAPFKTLDLEVIEIWKIPCFIVDLTVELQTCEAYLNTLYQYNNDNNSNNNKAKVNIVGKQLHIFHNYKNIQ